MNKKSFSFNLDTYFLVLLAIAILARVLWIFFIPSNPISDFGEYQRIATGLANGEIPVAYGYQGMGYPTFLSLFYIIFNSNDLIIPKILNVILSSLTIVFIYFILKKLFVNKTIIAISIFVVALFPNYIAYTSVVGTEVFTNFLFVLIISAQVSSIKPLYKYPLLGVLIGLAALTKPYFIAYPLLLMVVEWLNKKNFKQVVILGIVSFVFLQITIAPWTYFNYKRFGEIVSPSFNGGSVLFLNNNDQNKRGKYMNPANVTATPEFWEKVNNTEPKTPAADELYKEEAINWIKSHPQQFIKLGFYRVQNTFLNIPWDIPQFTMQGIDFKTISDTNKQIYEFVYQITYRLIYFMTVLGFIFTLYQGIRMILSFFSKEEMAFYQLILPLNIAMLVAIPFVFEGQPRYNFPALFLLAIAAVVLLYILFVKLFKGKGAEIKI